MDGSASEPQSNRPALNAVTAGGLGGGSVGTIMIAMVNTLPDDNMWKSWLVIIMPGLSVLLSGLILWGSSALEARRQVRLRREAIEEMRDVLTDNLISREEKEKVRQRYSRFRASTIDLHVSMVQTAPLADTVRKRH